MSISSQGTQIYFVDPSNNQLYELDCPTGVTVPRATRETLDATCINTTGNARILKPGLGTPPTQTLSVLFDPASQSQVLLVNLQDSGETLNWFVGLPDGTTAPTVDVDGDVTIPTDRSFWVYDGYVADTSMAAEINALLSMEFTLQMSGQSIFIPKTV